ncbi:MAG: redoxin domain-containing protein [Acidimicrobiia bacterium]|nr:redoxin domain-containing protein [Acidimicrobiia bacterium]
MATKTKAKSSGKSKRRRSTADDRRVLTSRTIAVVVVLLAVLGLLSARFGLGPSEEPVAATDASGDQVAEAAVSPPALTEAPPNLGPAPELVDIDGWINADPTTSGLSSYGGQVRIVQYWTFGCFNCKNTLPHLKEIYNRYQPNGLEIIGVHAPEFDREADPANINAAVVELGVNWPVALDTSKANFRSWQGDRRFWPRTYVLDQNGNIRFDHIGEGAYDELEATVAHLLANGA